MSVNAAPATGLSARDGQQVQDIARALASYTPGPVHVLQTVVEGLNDLFSADQCIAFRCEHGELGWHAHFVYAAEPATATGFREFLKNAPDRWSRYYPGTPAPYRNRVVRPKEIRPNDAITKPLREFEGRYQPHENDNIGVVVCDEEVELAWVGAGRGPIFTNREEAILEALVDPLRVRLLLEHQLGRVLETEAALVAALEAIPTATFLLRGTHVAFANETGRLMLDGDRSAMVALLKLSLDGGENAPFALTPIGAAGAAPSLVLAVRRGGDATEVARRGATMGRRYALTGRQIEVLSLLARGYANKTIADQLDCSVPTIENHVTALLGKVLAGGRAELVARFWTTI